MLPVENSTPPEAQLSHPGSQADSQVGYRAGCQSRMGSPADSQRQCVQLSYNSEEQ